MAAEVEVQVVGPDRWAQVRELRLAALADAPDAFLVSLAEERTHSERWWRERLEREQAATFVASLNDADGTTTPVGLAVVAPAHDGHAAAGLYAVWVAPDARGRGVGDALLAAAIDHARRTGRPRLLLDVGDHNQPAIALYERHGFVPTGRTFAFPPPREHITEHERVLELTPHHRPARRDEAADGGVVDAEAVEPPTPPDH